MDDPAASEPFPHEALGTHGGFCQTPPVRVIVAERDGDRLAWVAACIRDAGHDVTPVSDGLAAWKAWEADPTPLLVADLDLPGLSGSRLCRRVQRAAGETGCYVLMLVSKQTEDDLRHALESGADDVLVRPLDADELTLRLLIAERRIASQARAQDEHRSFMDLLAEAPDLIQTVALDGQLLYVNRAWEETLGYVPQEGVALSFFDLVVPRDRAAMRRAFRYVGRGRAMRHMQTQLLRRDGQAMSVEGSLCPRFRGKMVTSIRVILHDVSRRNRAEAVLRNVLEGTSATTGVDFYRSLVRHLSGALEVRHAIVAELIPGAPDGLRTLAVWSGDGYRRNRSVRFEDSRGPLFPGSRLLARLCAQSYLGVPVLGADGEAIGLLCVLHDGPMRSGPDALRILSTFAQRAGAELERQRAEIARRELDRRMQESQKLESLGVMAGGIAHDFNNLLTGIMGYASLALHCAAPSSRVARYLGDIETASRRAADLATQMLAYSGKGQFVVQPVDVREVIAETTALLRTDVTSRGVALDYDLPVQLPAVQGDATQLRQIVMNLVINASQAIAPGGGTVAVRATRRHVDAALLERCYVGRDLSPGPYLAIEVVDDGIGMDARTAARIFDPFFTTKPAGRGLGLATVVGIIRGHHGALHVETAPGRGTTMSVFLPTTTAPVLASTAASTAEPPSGEGLVLVVDDEPSLRDLATAILETGGYCVVTACNGREGLAVLEERGAEIEAVLLDMTMPVMGGVEAFHAMRTLRPDVRVVVSSGYTESDALDRFGHIAPTAFLQKPYSAPALLRVVGELIATRSVPA